MKDLLLCVRIQARASAGVGKNDSSKYLRRDGAGIKEKQYGRPPQRGYAYNNRMRTIFNQAVAEVMQQKSA